MMKMIYRIARAELNKIFSSPVAWLVLIVFVIQCGIAFCDGIWRPVKDQELGRGWDNLTLEIYLGLFENVITYLYFYIPLLTMGLMSQEYSSGSVKLLYSSPVTNTQIILGKYLSMMIYGGILLGGVVIYTLVGVFTIENADIAFLFSNLLGIYLLICVYAAIGLFMSCLTNYQIVAAVATFIVLTFLNLVSRIGLDYVRDITYWLALNARAHGFLKGLICSEDVIYFLVVVVSFLILSIWHLQRVRENKSAFAMGFKYVILMIVVGGVSYLASRPLLTFYWDTTYSQRNTLAPVSQELLGQLDGDLKITTYVNLLDENYESGLPSGYKTDFERFRSYFRFKPRLKMDYVYYYDSTPNVGLERLYPGLNDREKAERICEARKWDLKKWLTPSEIREKIGLSDEKNRFIRVIEWKDSVKTFLRIYDDPVKYPGEPEIGAALKRLSQKPVKVAFLTGHGERSIYNDGEIGYSDFSIRKTSRAALINQGFKVTEFSIEGQEIPEDIDILVIADVRKRLSLEEYQKIQRYIKEGRNLIVLGEPRGQKWLNPIVSSFGVEFLEGRVVQKNENYLPLLVTADFTYEGAKKFREYARMYNFRFNVVMPGCTALSIVDKGYEVCTLARTRKKGCWNELAEFDSEEAWSGLNEKTEGQDSSYSVAVALSRNVGNREQRIIVVGDADCISNGELERNRAGILNGNAYFLKGAFRWLSNDEYPVYTTRPYPIDNKISLNRKNIPWIKCGAWIGLPLFLIILYGIISNRRKRK